MRYSVTVGIGPQETCVVPVTAKSKTAAGETAVDVVNEILEAYKLEDLLGEVMGPHDTVWFSFPTEGADPDAELGGHVQVLNIQEVAHA